MRMPVGVIAAASSDPANRAGVNILDGRTSTTDVMERSVSMSSFEIRLQRRNIREEELLSDLRRVAATFSRATLTKREYDAKGQFGATTILRRFKQWNQALQKAGLEAPNRQYIPDAELFENIANVWTILGRQPFGSDMKKAHGLSKISLGTYEGRFGSWNKALLSFGAFITMEERPESIPPDERVLRPGKRTREKINWRLRAEVLIRDNCICQMCGASPAKDSQVRLHADHIIPWSKGGETVLENLRTLCMVCNIGKSDYTPGA